MSVTLTVIIIIILFIFLLMLGMHISSVLLLTGMLGVYLLVGLDTVVSLLQLDTYATVASYTLTTIPLFVLMSQFILRADIIKYLYSLVFKMSKGRSGILGGFTIILGGFLGAVSGSASAISATLGQIAVPELKKHGYSENLSGAIAASAGSLSSIIPPSIGLIVYGSITQTSISSLFIAVVIPGLLTIIVLSAIVLFYYNIEKKEVIVNDNPEDEDATEEYAKKEYIVSISTALIIMIAIFGGIYSGIFTPTEAGGIGAFITLIAALFLRKVNANFIKESAINTIKISVMVLMIMVSATVFSRFITLSQIPNTIISLLNPILGYPILTLIILLIIWFIAFMFLEGAAAVVMLVPITLPVAEVIGISSLEFGVLITLIGTAGLLTPPVGLSVYSVAGATKIPVEHIFKYTMVFAIVISLTVGTLLIIFPQLINWLPNSM